MRAYVYLSFQFYLIFWYCLASRPIRVVAQKSAPEQIPMAMLPMIGIMFAYSVPHRAESVNFGDLLR